MLLNKMYFKIADFNLRSIEILVNISKICTIL